MAGTSAALTPRPAIPDTRCGETHNPDLSGTRLIVRGAPPVPLESFGSSPRGRSPLVGEGLHLADDQVDGGALVVGWVVVAGEKPTDVATKFGAHRFPGEPVDGNGR